VGKKAATISFLIFVIFFAVSCVSQTTYPSSETSSETSQQFLMDNYKVLALTLDITNISEETTDLYNAKKINIETANRVFELIGVAANLTKQAEELIGQDPDDANIFTLMHYANVALDNAKNIIRPYPMPQSFISKFSNSVDLLSAKMRTWGR
jgi:hypothetical protein